jgi:hypothetical protein
MSLLQSLGWDCCLYGDDATHCPIIDGGSYHEEQAHYLLYNDCLRVYFADYLQRSLCISEKQKSFRLTRQPSRTASHHKLYDCRGCSDKGYIHRKTTSDENITKHTRQVQHHTSTKSEIGRAVRKFPIMATLAYCMTYSSVYQTIARMLLDPFQRTGLPAMIRKMRASKSPEYFLPNDFFKVMLHCAVRRYDDCYTYVWIFVEQKTLKRKDMVMWGGWGWGHS